MASAVLPNFDVTMTFTSRAETPSHPTSPLASPDVPATPTNTPATALSTPIPASPPCLASLITPPEDMSNPISYPNSPFYPVPANTPASPVSPAGTGTVSPIALDGAQPESPNLHPHVPPNSPETWAKDNGNSDVQGGEDLDDGSASLAARLAALGIGPRSRAVSTLSQAPEISFPKAPDDNEYYEVRLNPGKGYGCFALKPIQRGTRILADSPLLIVREPEYLYDDIKATYDKLSPTDQALYMSLHSAHNQDPANWPKAIHPSVKGRERKRIEEQASARFAKEPSLISIFQTNCIEHESGAAIFPYAARFNHSCSPNACFTWNSAIGKETIHATRNINCGEEITVAYCDTTHSKSLRRYELKHYGFLCDCRACNDESDPEYASKSAERRYRLQELEDLLASMRESGKHWGMGPESIPQLLEMVNLLLEEGDYTNRLAATYMDIALVCEAQGDLKFAKKAAEKALQVSVDCYGLDHPTMMDHFILYERLKDKMEGGKAKSEDAVENEVDS